MARKKLKTAGKSAQSFYRTFVHDMMRGAIQATALLDVTQQTGSVVIPVQTVDQVGNPLNTTVTVPVFRVTDAEYEDPG